jgi:peptidoglycan/LPS O-acetylase OafA/YrhL
MDRKLASSMSGSTIATGPAAGPGQDPSARDGLPREPVLLGDRAGSLRNTFDVLRLAAATLVLVSHCFALTQHAEPLAGTTGMTLGELGISMFFAMSGFLIAKSWLDQPAVRAFAIKRALRLLPGLWGAVLFTTFVVGPLFTDLSLGAYLTQFQTWWYAIRASLLDTVHGQLPGVFAGNPWAHAVNGSLWSLPIEAAAYAGAAACGAAGLLRRPAVVAAIFGLLLIVTTPAVDFGSLIGPDTGQATGPYLPLVLRLWGLFAAGAALYVARDRVPLRWDLAAGLAAVWILLMQVGWGPTGAMLAVPYVLLVLAYRTPARLSLALRGHDVSYGVYVFAYPVQQAAAAIWGHGITPAIMFALAVPPTFLLAGLSWRYVEEPALALKRRFAPRPDPRAEAHDHP